MCIYPIIWVIGSALATYLFNFRSSVRFWALGLMLAPPILGVTLALGPGGTGDPVKDSMLVNWWLVIAALSTGASLVPEPLRDPRVPEPARPEPELRPPGPRPSPAERARLPARRT